MFFVCRYLCNVKKATGIFSVFIAVMLYCFATGMGLCLFLQSATRPLPQTTHQHFAVAAVPGCQHSGAEIPLNVFSISRPAPLENSFSRIFAMLRPAERFLERWFAHYALSAENFPVRLRKSNLIFPFHYFW